MPEIGTSGSMSEDGKRSVAEWPKLPRPSSTLPDVWSGRAMSIAAAHKMPLRWRCGRLFLRSIGESSRHLLGSRQTAALLVRNDGKYEL